MTVQAKSRLIVTAAAMADWLESQPERWWVVDGDPLLMSLVDFPCPSDELAPVIRRIGKSLCILGRALEAGKVGEVAAAQLDGLCDTDDRFQQKTLLLSWENSEDEWLLVEDKTAAGP